MDIKMLGGAADALVDRLRSDGYSDEMVRNARWVLGNFAKDTQNKCLIPALTP